MTLPGKRMRKYHPRRSRKVLSIQKQEFLDCLHTLDLEAGKLIVLCKEGSVNQIQEAQSKASSTYHKFKDQLVALGAQVQETVKERAISYLKEYHKLVESVLSYDEAMFRNYYASLLKIKALASLKKKTPHQDLGKENHIRSA
jgi:hypothetical protein